MVYIHSWQEFQDAAEALYAKAPNKARRQPSTDQLNLTLLQARYCVKWNPSDRKLVLKITDHSTCIKFKTYSSIFLNRFDALNLTLIQKIQNTRHHDVPAAEPASMSAPPPKPEPDPVPGTLTTSPPAGGVSKKKKPKKKK